MLPLRFAACIALASAASVPVAAAVTGATPSSFVITHRVELKAAPDAVFATLGQPAAWWSERHTYSGRSDSLRMRLAAGGCFCEQWDRNSVEHGRVVYVAPGKALRLQAALGPLQEMAVNGILDFRLEPRGPGCVLTMTYRVRGTPDAALDKMAPAVDRVLVEQMQRLAAHVDASVKDAPAPGLEERFFDSAGVRLRYLEVGKGDPVILLHDIGGDSDTQWRDTGVMRLVADNARAIALDARGHGKSGKPADPARYGAEMAEDVVRLMDHLGLAKAHVVGYGMGAQVAARLAATHPERLQTLVLAGATSLRRWTPQDEQRAGADPLRQSLRELVVPDERMTALPVPTLGVVAMQDAAMRDFIELKQVMPRLVRMVAIEGATHETAPASSDFGVALMYFLRYHPMAK